MLGFGSRLGLGCNIGAMYAASQLLILRLGLLNFDDNWRYHWYESICWESMYSPAQNRKEIGNT